MRRAALALAAALICSTALAQTPPVDIELLAINDFHGSLEPPSGANGRIGGVEAGGAEYLATHLANAVKANPDALIVGAGDLINASPILSALFHDEPSIEALNAMGLAVTAVGNHEFDEGPEELLRMQNGGCGGVDPEGKCRIGPFKGARFAYLAANVVRDPTPEAPTGGLLMRPYVVRTIKGVKVGFIGETLEDTPVNVSPAAIVGLRFLDEAETANRYAAELKAQGVNAIVLLLHLGAVQAPGSDYNGCTGMSGSLLPVLERLTPDIKVVVSAHSHAAYNCVINGRVVTSASSLGRLITHISMSVDPATGAVIQASARNAIVTRDVPKDPRQTAIIERYSAMAAPVANRVVGRISADITRALNRSGESALGDVLADAQLAATMAPDKGGAVAAFMNPGGIRAEIVASQVSGTEQPGEITFGELFQVQPFANMMTVATLSGAQIKQLLEQQFDNPSPGRNLFLQVSQGFTYSYRLNAPAGQRVDAASIRINGVAVDPARDYRIAQNNFLGAGGDSFSVFAGGRDRIGGDIDIDALIAWFDAHHPVDPGPQDRIRRLD